MKIAKVESYVARGRHYVLIETDDGITGVGQSACHGYPEATDQVVRRMAEYLVGQDPMRIEHHGEYLYRMAPFRGSILSSGVSGIDIALWDIKGKALGVPVWQLLGGKTRERVRLHLLLMHFGVPIDDLVAAAVAGVDDGFTALKFDPLTDDFMDLSQAALIRSTVERVAAVREAVGPNVDLLIELHRKLRPNQARPLIEAIAPFHALFYEDPIQIDSITSQAEFATRLTAPIGNGERMHTIWEFRELLVAGGAQYVRPDVGSAGGLTHCKKIAAIAESFHAVVTTHNYLGPILTTASAHLDLSIPNFVVQEYTILDEDRDAHPVARSMRREGGYLVPSDEPGLGIEFDRAHLEQQMVDDVRPLRQAPLRLDGSVSMSV